MSAILETSLKTPILVIDDSRTVRVSLSKILNSKFNIIEAEDGEAGWKILQADTSIKLVITDIMMPKLDGYGLICRIRGSDTDRLQKIPIIVVTSAEDDLSRERAHACGANNFIVKPVKADDLLKRVNFHTEANLSGGSIPEPQIAEFESHIETAVIEAPDVERALEILDSGKTANLAPYAVDIALKILPLLEFCDETFTMGTSKEIQILKKKLQSI
jgi:CheY-like chemotaxis protein